MPEAVESREGKSKDSVVNDMSVELQRVCEPELEREWAL